MSYDKVHHPFYNTTAWKKCRAAYMLHVNGRCERCMSKGLHVPARVVHHKIYLDDASFNDPAIALNFDNLEALCTRCHNNEHKANTDGRRWHLENGRVIVNDDVEY